MLQLLLSLVSEDKKHIIIDMYGKHAKRMLKIASCRFREASVPSHERLAEDVVQLTFEILIKNIDRINYDPSSSSLAFPYAYTVLHHEIDTMIAKEKRRHIHEVPSTEDVHVPTVEELLDQRLVYSEVVAAIKKMKPIYRGALYLYYIQEHTVDEIAAELGLPVSTVYTRLKRGIEFLQKLFKGGRS
ncbi:MAG: sigma-70 family RNA polymerase sigma factor [Clostridia bacterium]|nr:sigma-70 family RNA polymerase sigma factor [Clostridia bacterium]